MNRVEAPPAPALSASPPWLPPFEPTRIIAIRHGETAWNAEGRLQGHRDIALSPKGQRQADRLADALAHEGLERVVASDLSRAWQTGQALAQGLGLPLHTDPGLRERAFGVFEGLTRDEIRERWPDALDRWNRRIPDYAPEGAESLTQFSARCLVAATRLARAWPGGVVAMVCHGGVLDCLYRHATGLALDAPRSWVLGNTGINRLLYTGEGFTVTGWNDQSHLDGLDGLALDEAG